MLRSEFEATKVLAHYAGFDAALFEEVFGADAAATAGAPVAVRLADLALRVPRYAHQLLVLELLYGAARETADFHRLRDVAGRVDVFGVGQIMLGKQRIAELEVALRAAGAMATPG